MERKLDVTYINKYVKKLYLSYLTNKTDMINKNVTLFVGKMKLSHWELRRVEGRLIDLRYRLKKNEKDTLDIKEAEILEQRLILHNKAVGILSPYISEMVFTANDNAARTQAIRDKNKVRCVICGKMIYRDHAEYTYHDDFRCKPNCDTMKKTGLCNQNQ